MATISNLPNHAAALKSGWAVVAGTVIRRLIRGVDAGVDSADGGADGDFRPITWFG